MDFELTEAQIRVRDTARRVAREVVAPRAAAIDEEEKYPEDVFAAFREAGLFGVSFPKEYGGTGEGAVALGLAIEEVAKYCCASGLILLLAALGTRPILVGGTEEQKKQWLPAVARGEKRASFLLTEPTAGSDAANIKTTAVRDGDEYVLNGDKAYASGVSDFCCVFAKTDPGAGSRGVSAFIVPRDTPGFSITKYDRKMGVKGVPTAHYAMRDARVPAANLIGGQDAENKGFNIAMHSLNSVRPLVGARGVGLAEGALTYALEYARNREAFGSALTDLQAIQFMFADMAIAIESSRALVYQAARLVDEGRFSRKDAAYLSVAKAVATETAVKVSSDALQVMGAQGYMKDHPLERHYRDARQLMIVEGTSQIQRLIISRALIEKDLDYS